MTHDEMLFDAEIQAGHAHKNLIQANAPGVSDAQKELAIGNAIYRLNRSLRLLKEYPRKTSGEIADMLEAAE